MGNIVSRELLCSNSLWTFRHGSGSLFLFDSGLFCGQSACQFCPSSDGLHLERNQVCRKRSRHLT
jgi:hypothetical protein